MLKSGLAAKQETFGDYSESVSDTHKLIACVYMSAGDVESAFCAFKKVVTSFWTMSLSCLCLTVFSLKICLPFT